MKVIVYLAESANGLISNARNIPDWLSPEFGRDFMEVSQRTQAVIMGKRTYDHLSPDHLPFKDGSIVVLTHGTKATPSQSNVSFTSASPEQIIAQLVAKGHSEVLVIGGTETVTAFVRDGMVNEIILIVEPVLFGSGLPITRDLDFEYRLSLLGLKQLNDHTIRLHYRIAIV